MDPVVIDLPSRQINDFSQKKETEKNWVSGQTWAGFVVLNLPLAHVVLGAHRAVPVERHDARVILKQKPHDNDRWYQKFHFHSLV